MFIRSFSCTLKLHCSEDDPSFRVCAVPIHEEPVSFESSLAWRTLHWWCYLTQYSAKVVFCFSNYEWAKLGVVIYLIATVILSIDEGKEQQHDLSKETPITYLFNWEAWADLLVGACLRWRRKVIPRTKKIRGHSREATAGDDDRTPQHSSGTAVGKVIPVISPTVAAS